MKKLREVLLVGLPVLFVVSCATPAYVEKDDTADFSRYQTFTWIDKSDKGEKKNVHDLTDAQVRAAVNEKLQKGGWKEVKSKPDVLISYDMLVEKNVKERNDPVYSQPYSRIFYNPYTRRYGRIFYPSAFLGYEDNSISVREGTLTVTMVDANTNKTIWQGWTTDEVNSKNVTRKEIQSSVNSIFRKFDVAQQ
jgi:hypothetical protein